MALQSSGPISISQIKTELGSASNSLRTLSSQAGFSTPDAMSEFYNYASEYMTGVTTSANDAYVTGSDYACGCIENITVYQTSTGRWLRGSSIGDTPLSGLYNLNSQIYNFSNGVAGFSPGTCSYFC